MSTPGFNFNTLKRGDCLLYFTRDLVDYAIALKTWTFVGHVEVYDGVTQQGLEDPQPASLASRNGIGVNRYPLRHDGLAAILRPRQQLNFPQASQWFASIAQGQAYDWLGLLCFTLAVRQGSPRKMFCSEFATNYYRQAGLEPFNPGWAADRTPPSLFLASPAFEWVWTDEKLW